ncbi:Glu/Leu/Phe/Val dehydrogenase dimerization domain-containing protein [Stenotrophomonas sp. MMGLT7]|uniref:Glu/Leu/Phe/Val family dehydrogenase n=1 Tax=Stenotrophomonas sp. MMGLT7 TaxID=2901227 RepID=UPI001E645510|nr:Glu/Leu/Phe/Val dehydrogenase dimerization domain-containing protein [Stenotrophomonas sp. MMGLT7]MCD7097385.1 leucine dehydrogenase [Stenotrophomonas sp. MMGLT7]
MLFETLETSGHEQVVFCYSPDAGLRAIIALHSTVLGPALGGVRMRPYGSTEAALLDALRLSRTMTYKNALAGLNVGGGKAVIIGDPKVDKTEVLFRAFGRYVESLGGRYITAEDVGTDVNDMEQIYLESGCVTGVHQIHGGSGDPAPFTAYGALQALMASLNRQFGHEEVGKASIAVQGLGHIGMELVKLLKERGAKLFVTDLDAALVERAVSEYGAEAVKPDEIYEVAADVFAPCALEGTLNEQTLPRLKAKVVCGTANNQLATPQIGEELQRRGILYAPDYAVNAGGVMNVSLEIDGYNRERAMRLIRSIYHTLGRIFDLAEHEAIAPQQAADRIAQARIDAIGKLKLPLGRSQPRFMGKLRGER